MACRFNEPVTVKTASDIFGNGKSFIEIMRGTIDANVKYCSKEKLMMERGIRPSEKGMGKEDKMAGIVKLIKDGAGDRSVFEAYPAMFLRYVSLL